MSTGERHSAHRARGAAAHRELVEPLLKAGVHVFVDKPLTDNLPDCEHLGRLAPPLHGRLPRQVRPRLRRPPGAAPPSRPHRTSLSVESPSFSPGRKRVRRRTVDANKKAIPG
ncbi:Gfo/Idh/MocA family oxidoreductase [Nonomuraea sp. NPDC050405]|uniref:Gfo/Idh/MocA family oxidoreductase n=1 Tax=Nonomuraea sp. NPDC050405 TaxID=3154509 RepID=UPI0033D3CF76